ncbi:MAG: hypothetical protein RL693_2201 [Verrucomicrobiota bacterium]|jgi:hypothetical protein
MNFYGGLVVVAALSLTSLLHAGTVLPAMQLNPSSDWDFSARLDSGWRQDHFEWTIAGDLNGSNPNILSELDWRNLNIVSAGGEVEVTFRQDWHLRLGGGYGWIVGGNNRDSDYELNDRRGESSRSTASTRGSAVDAGVVLAHDFEVLQRITLTPLVGFIYHRQRLNDRAGVQVLDTESNHLGPFSGLDSTYTAEWWGPECGLDVKVTLAKKWRWLAGVRYEWLQYHGIGIWNLRQDLKNFNDRARGDGWICTTGLEWDFAPRWTLSVMGEYGFRETGHDVSDTEYSDHSHETTRFNEAEWESLGVRVTVSCSF